MELGRVFWVVRDECVEVRVRLGDSELDRVTISVMELVVAGLGRGCKRCSEWVEALDGEREGLFDV